MRNAKVYETDGVISNLLLSQDGIVHTVEGETTGLHVHEDGTDLKVFVPVNKDDQDYTFAKALPEKLFRWLMTHPVTQITEEDEKGATAARNIILTPCSRLARALEECGIRTVGISNVDEVFRKEPTTHERVSSPTTASDDGIQVSAVDND